jgi:hypothetical protein
MREKGSWRKWREAVLDRRRKGLEVRHGGYYHAGKGELEEMEGSGAG